METNIDQVPINTSLKRIFHAFPNSQEGKNKPVVKYSSAMS